jgi:flagellar assembly protein FliH
MASVIKAGRVIPSGTTVRHSAFNLEDMSQNASKYLDSVKTQAADIVKQAQQRSEQVHAEAEQRGRQAAEQAARQAALEEFQTRWKTLAPALKQAIEGTRQMRAAWIKQWEENMITLVIGVAERVIRDEVARRPDIPRQWIRESLELASGSASITLHLNPDDFAALGPEQESLRQQFSQLADCQIVPDTDVSAGGCRVETDYGCIDQQIESQLLRIQDELSN